jgi:hypothetical protein
MMRKPILCLDFDGVIHSYISGWSGEDVIADPPVAGAFDFIIEATRHFQVAVFSSRSRHPKGIDAMRRWFVLHGLPSPVLGVIDFPTDKPPAKVTLDDRALTFAGTWPDMESLKAFEPWSRQVGSS